MNPGIIYGAGRQPKALMPVFIRCPRCTGDVLVRLTIEKACCGKCGLVWQWNQVKRQLHAARGGCDA
jgi:hypothetical protein